MSMSGVLPADLIQLTPSPWTEPFWAATAQHRLVLPRCGACGTFRFPPTPFCWVCRSGDIEWMDHDGHGAVYAFTVIRHAVIPPVADALPLIAAVVELVDTEGCRLVGNVVDAEPDAVHTGAAVRAAFYDVREGTTIPVFRID
jgi:uncharacterized OB-fold protein